MKKHGILLVILLITGTFGGIAGSVSASETGSPLFEGYLSKGEAVLLGPLMITLTDTQKDYGNGEYYAMLIIMKEGKILNAEYKTMLVPNPQKIQFLLLNPAFLVALAETQGYDMSECEEYINNTPAFNACLLANAYGFYQWLNTAPPRELADAVVRTIQTHPELGIKEDDVLMEVTYPDITPVREGETVEVDVDGQKTYITVNEIYPNGVRLSVSGPAEWRAATLPGLVISNVEVPPTVQPGETVTVKVHLKNEGAQKVRYLNVFVTPTPMSFNGSSSIASAVSMALSQSGLSQSVFYPEGSAAQYIEYLEGKENVTLTFRIKINPNANVGTYPLYVGVVYFTGMGANMRMVQSYNFIALTVKKGREGFVEITDVETEPREISPGDTFRVRFTLVNAGAEPVKAVSLKISSYQVLVPGAVGNVDLSSLSQLPVQGAEGLSQNLQDYLNGLMHQLAKENIEAFLPIGEDNVKYAAELMPGENVTLEFTVKANDRLANGIYPMRIELKYVSEPDESEVTDERLVGIEITGRVKLILSKASTSPSKVLPGTDNVEVSFKIDNVGTGTARTVIVRPLLKWPFTFSESGDQMLGLGSLGKGDSAQGSFRVNVADNASSGTYEIPLLLTYTNDLGMEKNLTLRVPVMIGAKPNIEVAEVRFDPEPLQGETVNVYVKLKNTGGEKATSVLIEGVVKADQPFSLDKRTDYIGDLAPGAVGEGVIVLKVDKNAIPKDYSIGLRIRAVGDPNQGDDNVYVFERTVVMTVGENTKTESNLRNLAIAIGALVVVVVLYTYMRSRKK
ncbi:hypothetical protein GQS_07285 [Thermococcus sp. 4557]|uniref:COG1361 S-layer family protein n=1 Tax=Thermococcus sp. (strain CGMCC 1.5172 / 4557) TaxID=1042877 RepID=UPI000219EAE5|nr:COG1361 S-layer family protein [Thermococcus sp. 4557]AEK73355.1 hypothetical protein GQS_07285 [Thermococcus sp. 4557]